jgi:hypothetical protein
MYPSSRSRPFNLLLSCSFNMLNLCSWWGWTCSGRMLMGVQLLWRPGTVSPSVSGFLSKLHQDLLQLLRVPPTHTSSLSSPFTSLKLRHRDGFLLDIEAPFLIQTQGRVPAFSSQSCRVRFRSHRLAKSPASIGSGTACIRSPWFFPRGVGTDDRKKTSSAARNGAAHRWLDRPSPPRQSIVQDS